MTLTNVRPLKKLLMVSLFTCTALLSTSCGDSGESKLEIPGVDGPIVTLNQDKILISMVFENIQLQGGLRYAVPKYKNSYIEVSPDSASDGTLMAVSVSLSDVLGGDVLSLPPQQLPGGRALPGVSTGSLPAVAFSIPKWKNMAFYVGPKFFGLFAPTNLDIGTNSIITARYNVGSKRAGNISMVGKDENGENSGFLLLLDLNATTKSRLKKVMNRYK
jgi:hypothetical protein